MATSTMLLRQTLCQEIQTECGFKLLKFLLMDPTLLGGRYTNARHNAIVFTQDHS